MPPDDTIDNAAEDTSSLTVAGNTIDGNIIDARTARLFVGSDRGIETLISRHDGIHEEMRVEELALRVDPRWLEEEALDPTRAELRTRILALSERDVLHLRKRAEATKNSFIASRYAHLLWRRNRRAVELARLATAQYLHHADGALARFDAQEATAAVCHATGVAVATRSLELLELVANGVRETATRLANDYGYRWILDLIPSALRLQARQADIVPELLVMLEPGVEFFLHQTPSDYPDRQRFTPVHQGPMHHLAHQTVDGLGRLRAALDEADVTLNTSRWHGQIEESRARSLEKQTDPPIAAVVIRQHYAEAERYYRSGEDFKGADAMRVEVERLREVVAGQMIPSSISIQLDARLVDAAIAQDFDGLNVGETLRKIGGSVDLLPLEAEGREHREAVMLGEQLMPPMNFDVGMNRASSNDSESIADARESNYYAIAMQVRMPFVGRLFAHLESFTEFSAESVLDIIRDSSWTDKSRSPFLESAISAYFRDDWIAFLRSVMPEFEGMIRRLVGLRGRPTTMPNRRQGNGVDEMRGLDSLLNEESVKTIFGADLWYNLKQLLVQKTGIQFRHADSHALLPPNYYTQDWSYVFMLLLIRLVLVDPNRESSSADSTPK